MTRLSVQVNN